MSLALAAAMLAATGASAEGGGEPAPKPVHHAPAKPKAAAPKPAAAAPAPAPTPVPPRSAVASATIAPPLVAPAAATAPATVVVSLPAALADWRALDAENTLILDTDKGRVVIELRPEFAPLAVARIKRLARTRVYDNLQFHRVVDGFMAQTGNPNNLDGGKSLEPDLPAEFTFRLGAETPRVQISRPLGESQGFIGAQPYVSVDEIRMAMSPDRRVSAWGAFCPGVVAMGHDSEPSSGNSEFFVMRAATRSLDRSYSVVGRVVMGLDAVRALTAGDPPIQPSRMQKARIMADLPESERPQIAVLNTLSPEFRAIAERVRAIRGADFSICDVEAPVRVIATPAPPKPAAKPKRRSRRPPPAETAG
ncbi:peptidylprolyl isomerase [Phenylobacterium sp. LjRoot225]|uniref:peptidylprolyl isomerase n=1 Tax=Phenylobacterium sp. LjRoot225 TaxID=3342285 RepID=UPI003ECEB38E